MRGWALALGCAAAILPAVAQAATNQIETVVVTGRAQDLTGIAASANQGSVSADDLALRPLLRPGEIVEEIPGVIITQHSGSGKANQYFLRGFNLDHGTDLAISVDGVPVNMPSHAHGQGYSDLNFLIPELVERVDYKKGPYYADVGDFGSAGAFDIRYYDRLPQSIVRVVGGDDGYGRGLVAGNVSVGAGNLIAALDLEHDDGPWVRGDDERKIDGVLRYTLQNWTLTAEAYHNIWNSTDQIPDRAILGEADPVGAPAPPAADMISRWGEVDPSDGGNTGRYALSADWRQSDGNADTHVLLYAVRYELKLFSNFTYFLDDPVHGDQIAQQDGRFVLGGTATRDWSHDLLGAPSTTTVGAVVRDDIARVGLFHTEQRAVIGTTHLDDVTEVQGALYAQSETRWTPWFRTLAGLRADVYDMDVTNLAGGNSGDRTAAVLSPKLSLVFGPWDETEFYLDFGQGFHSNDARGTVSAVDPATPLPRSTGAEFGVRTSLVPGLRTELSLWWLHLQSELVWDGDAGGNEPSGPTDRLGVELANWYTPTPWLTIDADYAYSQARFSRFDPLGQHVPEALNATFDGGVAVHDLPGVPWYAGLRVRYFGPRALTQDGAVHSKATTLLYADLGYRIDKDWSVGFDVFNLLNAHASDIDYFYTSRLPGEPLAGVDDVHTHPSEPREFRVSLTRAL